MYEYLYTQKLEGNVEIPQGWALYGVALKPLQDEGFPTPHTGHMLVQLHTCTPYTYIYFDNVGVVALNTTSLCTACVVHRSQYMHAK